jgi:hypothetical protein
LGGGQATGLPAKAHVLTVKARCFFLTGKALEK